MQRVNRYMTGEMVGAGWSARTCRERRDTSPRPCGCCSRARPEPRGGSGAWACQWHLAVLFTACRSPQIRLQMLRAMCPAPGCLLSSLLLESCWENPGVPSFSAHARFFQGQIRSRPLRRIAGGPGATPPAWRCIQTGPSPNCDKSAAAAFDQSSDHCLDWV